MAFSKPKSDTPLGILVSDDGVNIPCFYPKAIDLICNNIIIYGQSKSGKSKVVRHILKIISEYVTHAILISTTEKSNRDFEGLIPKELIYNEVNLELLKTIWDRQEAVTELYNKINDIVNLKRIFDIVASPADQEMFNRYMRTKEKFIKECQNIYKEPGELEAVLANAEKEFNSKLVKFFKGIIRIHRNYLLHKMDLIEMDRDIVKFLDLNPNMVLIFDDCNADIATWGKDPTVGKMFFQGRHNNLTTIYTMQDDAKLAPGLRKNAHISIFTSPGCAYTFSTKETNGLEKRGRKMRDAIIERVFRQDTAVQHHRKLIFLKDNKEPFQYIVAKLWPTFRIGDPNIWEYCDRVKRDERATTTTAYNRFFKS